MALPYDRRVLLMLGIQNAHLELQNVNFRLLQLQRRRRRRIRRRQRRIWAHAWSGPERRREFGLYDQLMVELRNEDEKAFVNFLRIPPEMFDEMHERLRPRLTKTDTKMRLALEPGLKLAFTLRHLASGARYKDMRYGWRVPHNTMSLGVREVCHAIIAEYADEVMPLPVTPEEWLAIARGFQERWNFPHALGAVDGKHVALKCPPGSGSTFRNYKKFFSIVLFAVVDSEYKFIYIDVGGRGASSDAQIWNDTDFLEAIKDGTINFPDDEPLPNDIEDMPYFLIGDDAFALRKYMQKPHSTKRLKIEERVFNYRLSRARRCVENAFGILANRFGILLTTMQHRPATVRLITMTCCILHNLMRIRYPRLQNNVADREANNGNLVPGAWREDRNMEDCENVRAPNVDHAAGKRIRNIYTHWVNSPAGSVPWQLDMI